MRGTKHPACGCTARTYSSNKLGLHIIFDCRTAGNPSARGGEAGDARRVTKQAECGIIAAPQERTELWYETPDLPVATRVAFETLLAVKSTSSWRQHETES